MRAQGKNTTGCRGCGGTLEAAAGRGRPRAFCLTCRPRLGETVKRLPQVRACAWCAGEFVGSAGRRFCSAICQDNGRPRLECWACGGPSGYRVGNRVQSASGAVICRPCRSVLAKPRPKVGEVTFKCQRCGIECSRVARGGAQRWCSKQCAAVAAWHRRRAREIAAFVEDVSPAEVFAADGYRCHLCKRMTLPTERVPHRRAPTVDHVIPLSKGGKHERANCRTACFTCNCAKRDRGGGEQFAFVLELIGA